MRARLQLLVVVDLAVHNPLQLAVLRACKRSGCGSARASGARGHDMAAQARAAAPRRPTTPRTRTSENKGWSPLLEHPGLMLLSPKSGDTMARLYGSKQFSSAAVVRRRALQARCCAAFVDPSALQRRGAAALGSAGGASALRRRRRGRAPQVRHIVGRLVAGGVRALGVHQRKPVRSAVGQALRVQRAASARDRACGHDSPRSRPPPNLGELQHRFPASTKQRGASEGTRERAARRACVAQARAWLLRLQAAHLASRFSAGNPLVAMPKTAIMPHILPNRSACGAHTFLLGRGHLEDGSSAMPQVPAPLCPPSSSLHGVALRRLAGRGAARLAAAAASCRGGSACEARARGGACRCAPSGPCRLLSGADAAVQSRLHTPRLRGRATT